MSNNTRRDFIKKTAAGAAFLASASARVLGANNRVRVGMIGVGARGQDLLKELLAVKGAELVAVADIYSRRLDEAEHFVPGVRKFRDHRQLLDLDLDGVIVASQLHLHARHFLDTIAAGKDLYCEKTMTCSIPQAKECLGAAKKSDRVIQIGLQHESSGALADTRKWIADGLLGKITQVESWMSRNTPHGKGQWVRAVPTDCVAENVDWKAFLDGRADRPFDGYKFMNWRLFWEFSGGNVTENMVHQIAWIMSALNLPVPTSAYMSGGVFSEKDGREVPDTIAVTLDFPGDVVITWQSTFSNSRYGLGERFLGSEGTVEHVAGATDMVSGKSDELTRYFPEPLNRSNGSPFTSNSPDQNHMANWIDCIRSRKTPNASVELGYRTAVAAHMANLAYRSKQRVALETARNMAV